MSKAAQASSTPAAPAAPPSIPGLMFGGYLDHQDRVWKDGRVIIDRPTRVRTPDTRSDIRRRLEAAIEQAIAALDAFDGDPDLEIQCEDEGAACEDEGWWDERETCDDDGACWGPWVPAFERQVA